MKITSTISVVFLFIFALSIQNSNAQSLELENFSDVEGPTVTSWNVTGGDHTLSQDGMAGLLEYHVLGDQGWGGQVDVAIQLDEEGDQEFFPDVSEYNAFKLNKKVREPADNEAMYLTVKVNIQSMDPGNTEETWEVRFDDALLDDSGEWQDLYIPFDSLAIPQWRVDDGQAGDNIFYPGQVLGFELTHGIAEGEEAEGAVLWNSLEAVHYDPAQHEDDEEDDEEEEEEEPQFIVGQTFGLEDFSDVEGPTVASWNVTGGDHTLTQEGMSALLDYHVIGDQGWGGQVDVVIQLDEEGDQDFFPDVSDYDGFHLRYMVEEPADNEAVYLTVKVNIQSMDPGNTEETWEMRFGDALLDDSGEWQDLYIPFDSLAIPQWRVDDGQAGDNIFYPGQVLGFELTHGIAEGEEAEGVVMWDELNAVELSVPTTVNEPAHIVESFELKQNYPNPFNPVTNIAYEIPNDAHVSLEIFNSLGQKVATLVDQRQSAGVHQVHFNAESLSSGIYLYRLRSGSFNQTKQMLLIK